MTKTRISFMHNRWEASNSFEDKDSLKAAGWRFDPAGKVWYTANPDVARLVRVIGTWTESATAAFGQSAERLAAEQEAAKQRAATSAITELAPGAKPPTVPDGLALYPFQAAGARLLADRQSSLLADEMGLGKTVQAIVACNELEPSSVLIVCPLAVKNNWAAEWAKWSTLDLEVGVADTKTWPQDVQVVICHPAALAKQEWSLSKRKFGLAIVDEAHQFKSFAAKRTQVLYGSRDHTGVQAEHKMALTGTPIVNRPAEAYSTLNWLTPRSWGTKRSFEERYAAGRQTKWGWDASGASHTAELAEKLRSTIMIRRRKQDVLTELPEKIHQVLRWSPKDLSPDVRAALAAEQAFLHDTGLAKLDDDEQAVIRAIERFQASGGKDITTLSAVRRQTALAKAPCVAKWVSGAIEEDGHKVVVWAHHRDVVDALAAGLKDHQPVTYTGLTKPSDRQLAVERFQHDDQCKVFLGSIQAAGVGLTLTASSHVVFAEQDWTPAAMSQAEDRCHRIGQRDSVQIQTVEIEGSIDDMMTSRLRDKSRVVSAVVDQERMAS